MGKSDMNSGGQDRKRCSAIVLAAGTGRRMNSSVAKQYLQLLDKPVVCHALQAFEDSSLIDDIILVTGPGDISYVQKDIVEKYGFRKVASIVEGGGERYISVWNALQVIGSGEGRTPNRDGYVLIHDGARPLVTERIIEDTYQAAVKYGACCAAVPVKDTIKIADEEGFAVSTPDRRNLFAVQTPQAFAVEEIMKAYGLLFERQGSRGLGSAGITDDAMVVETMLDRPVKLVEASYENIKITTPEDLDMASQILENRRKHS